MAGETKELYSGQPTTTASLILTNSATRRKTVVYAIAKNKSADEQTLTFYSTANGTAASADNEVLRVTIMPKQHEVISDLHGLTTNEGRGLRCAASTDASVNLFISGYEDDLA